MREQDRLTVGLAQIAPSWLNQKQTILKIISSIEKAAKQNCNLVAFGEALLPGYPFWIDKTDGAQFNNSFQKELHSHYMTQAVEIESGDLDDICRLAKDKQIAVVLGCIERPKERGGHSLYCSLVYINEKGIILSVHRKLIPTYEERLTWSPGDGHGLQVHPLRAFTIGSLNCWENWMPLVRSSLYAQGEDLHVAIWPGGVHNTHDITRFIAKESRSFVLSVSGFMQKSDIPKDTPHYDKLYSVFPEITANGGSCIAGPDGEWIIKPFCDSEKLIVATIDHSRVREERQNFDPSGHYSRPDITTLSVNRERQSILKTSE
ncbi:MAG: carbon-nitrogen hydrolase family protein [Desulfobacteraceae bacterium]|nr:carbon-nitrogen hydrolase family protein [Desulfobacteraceae bacterium]